MVSLPDGSLKPITKSLKGLDLNVIIQPTSKLAGQKGPSFRPVFLNATENETESTSYLSDDETDRKIIHFTDLIVNLRHKKPSDKPTVGHRNQRRSRCESPFIPDYRKKYRKEFYKGTTPRKPVIKFNHSGNKLGTSYGKKDFRRESFGTRNFNNKPNKDVCPWIEPERINQLVNSYKMNVLQQVPSNNVFLPQQTILVNDLQMFSGQAQSQRAPIVISHPQHSSQLMPPPPVPKRTAPEPVKPGILGTTPYSPIPESFMHLHYQKNSSANQNFHFRPSSSVELNHSQSNRPWLNNRDANIVNRPMTSQAPKTRTSLPNNIQLHKRNVSQEGSWEYEANANDSLDDSPGNYYKDDYSAPVGNDHQSDGEPGNRHHFQDGTNQHEFSEQNSYPEWQNDQYYDNQDDYQSYNDQGSSQKFHDQNRSKEFFSHKNHQNYVDQNNHQVQVYRNDHDHWENQHSSFKRPSQRGRGSIRRSFRSRPNRYRGMGRGRFYKGHNNQKNNFEWRTMAQ